MQVKNVLVFAPHPDDEVLGCGGVIARHVAEGADVYICYVTSGFPPVYDNTIAVQNGWPHNLYPEIKASQKVLGVRDVFFLQFPVVALETVPRYELTGKIQELINQVQPDVVYIPHFGDMQKDHAITSESVMVCVRPKGAHTVSQVYAYETLSETEWNIPHSTNAFMPNVFVDIGKFMDKKIAAMKCYQSQLSDFPNPRSLEAMASLAKLRASTMNCSGGAAEAFMLIREYRA